MKKSLDFTGVCYTFDTLGSPLIADLSVRFGPGWTGIVGANGAGKTTLLRLATGDLSPSTGTIGQAGPALYCAQRTDDPPDGLDTLLQATDGPTLKLCGQLGLQDDWLNRWHTLSHGERKRAQLAVALWREPAVLAVDEPSNHIDAEARVMLLEALRRFRGIGLLVSHDRAMLDELCSQCLFIDPPYPAVLRPGGYAKGYEQALADNERARVMRDKAKQEVRQIRRNMAERRERAAREHKVRSKRGLAKKDHDTRAKINAARLTDSKAGASLRQVQGRMRHAEQHLAGIHVKKQAELGFWLPQCRSKMDYLLSTEPGTLLIGDEGDTSARQLQLPELKIRPDDRVAITGPNGAGKSTLIRHLMLHLLLPMDRVMLMPQEISVGESETIIRQVRQTPPNELGRLMNVISRLGSDPNRLLQTALPSPGEVRKMLLAIGVVCGASLIVMDEPTNHLDLPSIRCLEDALAECPCALVLVSHDEAFLKRLTTTRWEISCDESEIHVLTVIDAPTL